MERSILENIVFAFMVGELGIEPITARKEVEKMTDEQLEKFTSLIETHKDELESLTEENHDLESKISSLKMK